MSLVIPVSVFKKLSEQADSVDFLSFELSTMASTLFGWLMVRSAVLAAVIASGILIYASNPCHRYRQDFFEADREVV